MSLDYIKRDKIMDIECDVCGQTYDFEGSFQECIQQFKDDGEWVFQDAGDWVHLCSEDCREDYNRR